MRGVKGMESERVSSGARRWRCLVLVGLTGAAAPALASSPGEQAPPAPAGGSHAPAELHRPGPARPELTRPAAELDPQWHQLDLAYAALARGDRGAGRRWLDLAATGPSPALAEQASRELQALPSDFGIEIYGEALAWQRIGGRDRVADLAPMLRLRATWTPPGSGLDFRLYASVQASRDVGLLGGVAGRTGAYSDPYATVGAGVLLRAWEGRLALHAQAGPAFDTGGSARTVVFDLRAGAALGLESGGCRPAPVVGAVLKLATCAELYGEAIYVRRLADDVTGVVRARGGFSWLATGPVAWQVLAEARAGRDRNRDFWDNFAESGVGHRWRLLRPFPLDLVLSAHGGTYLGFEGRDPAPRPLRYADLRLLAATGFEL